jgi:energy-coupling factor transporter ATP-binding protein EcfA2
MHKRGIVIFVGGTGTGKSTSLAALVGYRNRMTTGHIITIEDPIEYVHEHDGCIITQREVGVDTESFEVALRNTLRQAPDVILIGEIRTRETMGYAIAFAETGHLVFATLHANNANQALDRIINFFPDEAHRQLLLDLSLNLRGDRRPAAGAPQERSRPARRGGDHDQHAAVQRPDPQGRGAQAQGVHGQIQRARHDHLRPGLVRVGAAERDQLRGGNQARRLRQRAAADGQAQRRPGIDAGTAAEPGQDLAGLVIIPTRRRMKKHPVTRDKSSSCSAIAPTRLPEGAKSSQESTTLG